MTRKQKMEETAWVWNANYTSLCPPAEDESGQWICVYLGSGEEQPIYHHIWIDYLVGRQRDRNKAKEISAVVNQYKTMGRKCYSERSRISLSEKTINCGIQRDIS